MVQTFCRVHVDSVSKNARPVSTMNRRKIKKSCLTSLLEKKTFKQQHVCSLLFTQVIIYIQCCRSGVVTIQLGQPWVARKSPMSNKQTSRWHACQWVQRRCPETKTGRFLLSQLASEPLRGEQLFNTSPGKKKMLHLCTGSTFPSGVREQLCLDSSIILNSSCLWACSCHTKTQ